MQIMILPSKIICFNDITKLLVFEDDRPKRPKWQYYTLIVKIAQKGPTLHKIDLKLGKITVNEQKVFKPGTLRIL